MKRNLKRLKKNLTPWLSNVYTRSLVAFIATFVNDFVWAHYISSITTSPAVVAGIWGMVTVVLGAFVVLSYVDDNRMIIPAGLGAFLGTYFAV